MQIKNEPSKSWFCEFNNPELHGFDGTPEEIVDKIIGLWIKDNPGRTCAVAYCVSALGLKHLHCVLEDVKSNRFTAIKNYITECTLPLQKEINSKRTII